MADLAYILAGNVLDRLGSIAYNKISLAHGMKDDLEKLKLITLSLQEVLPDAETKQEQRPSLKTWVTQLKDIFNDAVDVLDEFECELQRRNVVQQYASFNRKVRRFFSYSNPLAYRFSVAHRIKEIRKKLDEVDKNMRQFQLIKTPLNVEESFRETHSFVNLSDVIGRDREKREFVDIVLKDKTQESDNQIPVISVIGIGGLGKTTLIKIVYNDDEIKEKFDLRIWVCVSLDFNVSKIVKDILIDATGNSNVTSNSPSLNQLQKSLISTLKGKKFLLVLDDVWNEDFSKWQALAELLSVGSKESRIIVTTRNSEVASIMGETNTYELKGLLEKDCFSLFFRYAFGSEATAAEYPQLKQIGEEIVRKCGGVPLALKTLGSLLRLKKCEAREWEIIRDSKIWELKEVQRDILPILRLSYNAMSPYLRQCFAYCSVFEEDTTLPHICLIRIWMALGMLPSPKNKEELEDIGESCFIELCNRSFFQADHDQDYFGLILAFRVHDLIHNFACSITQNECSIINSDDNREISDLVRYLRVVINENNLKKLSKLKKLKCIHVKCTGEEKDEVVQLFLSTCISTFKNLRVFDLSELSFEVLPSSIGSMKQLRYLDLYNNEKIKRLPDSICKLQSLQTLIFGGCVELEELPKGIWNLVSLRILSLTTKQTLLGDCGIGRLKSIRILIILNCKNLKALPDDLIYCTTLNTLAIIGCQELMSLPKGMECLTSLHTLIILGCDQLNLASESIKEDVQWRLQTFVIDELPMTTDLPQWLQHAAKTLRRIQIEDCSKLVRLPEWLPKLMSLEKLVIKDCPKLLSLPDGMEGLTSLTHLKIEDCDALEERCEREVGPDWHKVAHVPNLSIGEDD
ncbi:putative disease resistance protein RGA4 [Cannabis sativa]|uniref:putative disease resistance protein RGA4 n=1 Tax=Cannabis sativa TaxID=3483 RepID=UPI0029CAA965|nr:putative disease resistance protein RGA4 [Cannabis sativa]